MGRLAARLLLVALAAAAVVAGELAWAEPAQPPTRVPVTLNSGQAPDHVVVVRGDHLWKISRQQLDSALGRPPANHEIHPYWRQVIEVNADQLRSGDPDLIYPGEVIILPEAGN